MIRKMVENGSKVSDIARDLNLDRKTVKKYSASRIVDTYGKRKVNAGRFDPFM